MLTTTTQDRPSKKTVTTTIASTVARFNIMVHFVEQKAQFEDENAFRELLNDVDGFLEEWDEQNCNTTCPLVRCTPFRKIIPPLTVEDIAYDSHKKWVPVHSEWLVRAKAFFGKDPLSTIVELCKCLSFVIMHLESSPGQLSDAEFFFGEHGDSSEHVLSVTDKVERFILTDLKNV